MWRPRSPAELQPVIDGGDLGAAGGCREAVRQRPSCPSRGRGSPHPGGEAAIRRHAVASTAVHLPTQLATPRITALRQAQGKRAVQRGHLRLWQMVVISGTAGGCREAVRQRPSCPSRGRGSPHPGGEAAIRRHAVASTAVHLPTQLATPRITALRQAQGKRAVQRGHLRLWQMVVISGAAGGCREAVRQRPSCPSRGRGSPHPGGAAAIRRRRRNSQRNWHPCGVAAICRRAAAFKVGANKPQRADAAPATSRAHRRHHHHRPTSHHHRH